MNHLNKDLLIVSCFFFRFRASINRMVKDVVCFHAEDFEKVVEKLKIDLYEPPSSQVSVQHSFNRKQTNKSLSSVYNGVTKVN